MDSLRILEKVVGRIAPGPFPSFTEAHLLLALEIISCETIGRARLSEFLRLGPGVTRTLIKHLKTEGLIEVSRSGIKLSNFGKSVLKDIRSKIWSTLKVPKSPLTIGPYNIAVLVRGASNAIRYGMEQRDAAIRVGAVGATTLICRGNRLVLPGVNEKSLQGVRNIMEFLTENLKPKENDVIIIGSAEDEHTAELGAKTAALELLRKVYENKDNF